MQVLDSSAFIHRYSTDEETVSTAAVGAELSGRASYRFDADVAGGMRLHTPSDASIDRVRTAADASGDAAVLSETDVGLVATAFELQAALVTDDYAMQNVADRLALQTLQIAQAGIATSRTWRFQCQGCGRSFDAAPDRCPVCGAAVTRKAPR
ncbi:MAG: NOB1 family endonuclease [Haloquadratum sp.]|jgi:UPF0271 protein|nr:NOB1 family endonuclease [Haloferacaceae archaeon]MDR9445382.1 NOB1 family endonuclease [Haloquadratum sp.]